MHFLGAMDTVTHGVLTGSHNGVDWGIDRRANFILHDPVTYEEESAEATVINEAVGDNFEEKDHGAITVEAAGRGPRRAQASSVSAPITLARHPECSVAGAVVCVVAAVVVCVFDDDGVVVVALLPSPPLPPPLLPLPMWPMPPILRSAWACEGCCTMRPLAVSIPIAAKRLGGSSRLPLPWRAIMPSPGAWMIWQGCAISTT